MKRKFTSAPAWVDYTYQFADWLDHMLSNLGSRLTSWRYSFLDRHCQCSQCLKRKSES